VEVPAAELQVMEVEVEEDQEELAKATKLQKVVTEVQEQLHHIQELQ
jgi:hypothetical protein